MGSFAIVLFEIDFPHLHYNVIQHVCEAISGNFVFSALNCLSGIHVVLHCDAMEKVNCLRCNSLDKQKVDQMPVSILE